MAYYAVFVLLPEDPLRPRMLDLGPAAKIDQAVRALRWEIEVKGTMQQVKRRGAALYNLLFAPLARFIGAQELIFVSPDGELNLIPFEVLTNDRGDFLVERYQFNYLSSGRDLARFEANKTKSDQIIVFAAPSFEWKRDKSNPDRGPRVPEDGKESRRSRDLAQVRWNPLTGTLAEAEAIADLFSSTRVKLYLHCNASEKIMKSVVSPRILHVATHGFFLESNHWRRVTSSLSRHLDPVGSFSHLKIMSSDWRAPVENLMLRSDLVLAGANHFKESPAVGEDGILTALEVSGMKLHGMDLVVLSACQTGVGEALRGEGVFGLRRAFHIAGARTVVMSLWVVPDHGTKELMVDFYDGLKRGKGKSGALRATVLRKIHNLRERSGLAHPFDWGAFVCVGEP